MAKGGAGGWKDFSSGGEHMSKGNQFQPRPFPDTTGQGLPDANSSSQLFDTNQLFNYQQASRYLGISVSKLKKLKAAGDVPFVPIGDSIRFRIASLHRWIQRKEVS
jgi:excisionase family DNA binding protein